MQLVAQRGELLAADIVERWGRRFGIPRATAYRWVTEATEAGHLSYEDTRVGRLFTEAAVSRFERKHIQSYLDRWHLKRRDVRGG